MCSFYIDEVKYTLESRLVDATPSIRNLLNKFNEGVSILSETLRIEIAAKTHIRGLSYFFTAKRAFIYLDIRRDFLSLIFYTDDKEIKGLQKANWVTGDDASGSERFRIKDDESIEKALYFAKKSCEIAIKTIV